MRRFIFLTAALTAALIAAPVSATTLSECVAAQVTPAMKQNIIKGYLANGMDGLDQATTPNAPAIALKCLPSGSTRAESDARRISAILVGYSMKTAAEAALEQRFQVTADRIDAAWRVLPPALRERFARGGKADDQSTEAMIALAAAARPDIPRSAWEQMKEGGDLNDPAVKRLADLMGEITVYGLGRGMFEQPDFMIVRTPSH